MKELSDESKRMLELTAAVCSAVMGMDPSDARKFFTSMIMNVVGNMDEEFWESFHGKEPCDDPECTNCTTNKAAMPAMEFLRNLHKGLAKKHPQTHHFKHYDATDLETLRKHEPTDRQSFSM